MNSNTPSDQAESSTSCYRVTTLYIHAKKSSSGFRTPVSDIGECQTISHDSTMTNKPSSPKVTVIVEAALLTMDVDTGASMTLILVYIYKPCLAHARLLKSEVKLQTYSREARYGDHTARPKQASGLKAKLAFKNSDWIGTRYLGLTD